ncbi:hypothetical protein LC653_01290 [Nostoc sp. CHAB 5784]|nr:hypothetical protein [Nostoc mirabile]MCC5662600.1 hypothetical protein [Nostoc mirabile CHAB5784]
MISGIVKDAHATINVEFRLPNLPDFTIEFVIDTGFTDYLCLPPEIKNHQEESIVMSVIVAKWTIDEYHHMIDAGILSDRKVELLKGEIVEIFAEGEQGEMERDYR